jgi:hypothetical protein
MTRKEKPAPAGNRNGPSQSSLGSGHEEDATFEPITIAVLRKGDGEVRITLGQYKGRATVDLRFWDASTPGRAPIPTKRGLALGIHRLPELALAIAKAEEKARELGLVGDRQ